MTEQIPILYHGRLDILDVIPPEQAFDSKLQLKDNLFAVYATHVYEIAAPYAFGIVSNPFRMLKFGEKGYIYHLDSKNFNKIDEIQWVSPDPVVPIKFDIVYKIQYLHLFLNKSISIGKRFRIEYSIWTKKCEVDKLIEGIDVTTIDDKEAINIAKTILHNELVKFKTQFDNGEIDGKALRDFLEKLDANWFDYIQ
jgi:hypothetical protein